jgi:hypothetical protein
LWLEEPLSPLCEEIDESSQSHANGPSIESCGWVARCEGVECLSCFV